MKTQFSALLASAAVATGAVVTMMVAPASAATFGFGNIADGDTVGDSFASEFSFDVTDYGSGKVLFQISNNGTVGTNAIKQVVFSLADSVSGLLSGMTVDVGNVGTVDFKDDVKNLSQSEKLKTAWFGEDFGATTDGGNGNSIQKDESLGITFNGNYQAVIDALTAGTMKLGIHVGSLPAGASDSYVSTPPNVPPTPPATKVPEPASLVGLGLVASGMVMARRRSVAG